MPGKMLPPNGTHVKLQKRAGLYLLNPSGVMAYFKRLLWM